MSKSNTFENDLLRLIFQGVPISGLADNAAVAPITQLYLALHTADPGEDGIQTTNEATYTGYARVGVLRSTSGWSVSGSTVSPISAVTFAQRTDAGPSATFTHVSIGTAPTGGGKVLYRGSLTPAILVAQGTIPQIGTGSTITED